MTFHFKLNMIAQNLKRKEELNTFLRICAGRINIKNQKEKILKYYQEIKHLTGNVFIFCVIFF